MFFICILTHCINNPYIKASPQVREKMIEWVKQYISVALCLAKLIPVCIALVIFNEVISTIEKASKSGCMESSDKMTGATFSYLEDEMTSSINSLWSQMFFDVLNILIAIASSLYIYISKVDHFEHIFNFP